MRYSRRSLAFLALLLVAAGTAAPAFGSAIIGRNVTRATLSIDRQGHAHVSYRSEGRERYVVAQGAINARAPNAQRAQVKFRFHYGLRGRGVCLPYDGPPLAWLVEACKAPDGSYWALQAWVRLKANYGGKTGAMELQLSHWRGPLPVLTMYQNWANGRYRHLFGRLTYRGRGVYGFTATGHGAPLDGYGRNIYVDTFDSRYGRGWHRENGFLTHHRGKTLGDFCYGFFPHSGHPSGQGTRYRATVEGPGVTPDVMWAADDAGAYDATAQRQMQALERSWGDPKCRT
jgi:hypothetical protein